MIMVKQFTFPTEKHGKEAIEGAYLDLLKRYREKQPMTFEELDYFDWAEQKLTEYESMRP